ncbi:unnamed protein product [Callosobruchus maculatus]|uniref:Uncharacterized protein n=1 Tax=Callosobruchus maculatus TaxID=64391 RepID=A0A653BJG7_CALMS|nr:unnamed protein product [Callosobruchus maculatus]
MNRSWKDNSASPGFVYFNNSNHQSPNDTGDFLAFNDTSSQKSPNNKFSPGGYSSPKHHGSPNNFQRTPNFQRSPRKFNLKNTFRYAGGRHSGNRSFGRSSSSGFDSSFVNTPPYSNYNDSARGNKSQGMHIQSHNRSQPPVIVNGHDVSMYIDHSCLGNPWEELERQLEQAENSIVAAPLDEDKKVEGEQESSTTDEGSSSSDDEQQQKNG